MQVYEPNDNSIYYAGLVFVFVKNSQFLEYVLESV